VKALRGGFWLERQSIGASNLGQRATWHVGYRISPSTKCATWHIIRIRITDPE